MLAWIRSIWRPLWEKAGDYGKDVIPRDVENADCEALLARAQSLFGTLDLQSSWLCVSSALEINPEFARAHALAAKIQLELHDEESALDHLTLAIHWAPDDWESVDARASLLERANQFSRAVAGLQEFLTVYQGHPGAALRLARLYYSRGLHDEALSCLHRWLVVVPESVDALNFVGLIEGREFGRLDEAERVLSQALTISPSRLDVLSNLGWVRSEQGRTREAIDCFDVVLLRNPEDQETRLMRSYANLRNAEFSAGWKDFSARHFSPLASVNAVEDERFNSLSSLQGRRIFVASEQGLGDQIMLASCFSDLTAAAGACNLECDPRLQGLFQRSFPSARFLGRAPHEDQLDLELSGIDCRISMGRLPGIFRNTWADFPSHSGYLRADPIKVSAWRKRLLELGPGPWVGISWRGGARATRAQLRSIPLRMWSDLLTRRAHFVSLQYGDCAEEVSQFGRSHGLNIWHWPETLGDYEETAALVVALDIVVSVCTAIVHLSGALGRPVLVLTPATPEWRYLGSGRRMPWYPSVTLYRQSPGESWEDVLQRVASALPIGSASPG